jgi:HPt (histidine-containing phosphotransfer) domain-containing protein
MKKNSSNQFSLDRLIKITQGDDAFIREMITLFLEKAPTTLGEINKSFELGDLKGIESKAHKLKSSIQIIGNDPLHSLLVDIENKAKTEISISAISTQLDALNEQMKRLVDFLQIKLKEEKFSN